MTNAIKYGPVIGPVGPVGPQGPPGTAVTGGRTFYLSNQGGSPPDYEGLALLPDSEPEEAMTAVGIIATDGEVLLEGPASPSAWVTEAEVPGVALIDAGVWTVKLFGSASAGDGPSYIRFKLFKVTDDLLTETLLFTWADSASLPTSVGPTAIDVEATAGTFAVDVTDRLVLRAYAVTESTTPVDVALYHSGTAHYTRLLSPIVAATVYSDLTPLSGGTAHPGVQNVASRGDHRHAHGIIAGGSTHALAVADVSHGYLSSTAAGALVGTSGTPGTANKFVTDADARNTNARVPTSHAATHAGGGADAIADAIASGASGLMSGADKAKLDNVEVGAQAPVALFGFGSRGNSTTRRYMYPGGGAGQAAPTAAQEVTCAVPVTFSSMRMRGAAGSGAAQNVTFTLMKNGADTGLLLTVSNSATDGTSSSASVSFVPGDRYSVASDKELGTGSAQSDCYIMFGR